MAAAKKPTRAAPKRRTPKKQKADSAGLDPRACMPEGGVELGETGEAVTRAGGILVGAYNDPLGGRPLGIAILPVGAIEPTPFQRDLSDTHHKRLAEVIQKTARFLDPVIAITAPKGAPCAFWTPNGRHRLEAMRRLGAKSITALVVPDREVAWQILALNTEKAHNLKERALEVVRIYRGLLEEDGTREENGFAFYLEDPALVTLGVCYEQNGRFAGGAYHPVLRRVETFQEDPIAKAIKVHEKLAKLTLEVEANVVVAVQKLKEKGLTSPYLRSFVVARINPIRFIKGDLPPAEKVLETMRDKAARFNTEKVKQEDLAKMGGGVPDEEG
jgi:ParB family transcriptional regulator, chromosome partitioning protein